MCSAPDPPKVEKIPQRAMTMLPDNGDPAVRMGLRTKRTLGPSAMIFANRAGNIGLPALATTAGTAATSGL